MEWHVQERIGGSEEREQGHPKMGWAYEGKQFDGGEFRILEPPPGVGSVKVNDNYYKPTQNIPKRYLSNGMITGNKPKDFLYDFVIEVTSFDIKVGNT